MQPDHATAVHADDVVEIRTTFPARESALSCGERLVHLGLAACVQVHGPVTSIYRWQGVIETVEEFVCHCKTAPAAAVACEREIRTVHPYTTPEILITTARGSVAYAAWVRESVALPSGDAMP